MPLLYTCEASQRQPLRHVQRSEIPYMPIYREACKTLVPQICFRFVQRCLTPCRGTKVPVSMEIGVAVVASVQM
jgi:hypothetical protein